MKATDFIKKFETDKANEVIEGVPDKTASHYVFRKVPHYYSTEFQSWFYDGEWHDSDCSTEAELIESYGSDFVVNLAELKRLTESMGIISDLEGIKGAKGTLAELVKLDWDEFEHRWIDNWMCTRARLEQAISDHEAIYGAEDGAT